MPNSYGHAGPELDGGISCFHRRTASPVRNLLEIRPTTCIGISQPHDPIDAVRAHRTTPRLQRTSSEPNIASEILFQGYFFDYENPTALSLAEVKPLNQMQQAASADNGLRKREDFQSRDPRLTFMSAFPVSKRALALCGYAYV